MTNQQLKKEIQEFWEETIKYGETGYPSETLAFAYMLGMPPNECERMFFEELCYWEKEDIALYNRVVTLINQVRKEKGGN